MSETFFLGKKKLAAEKGVYSPQEDSFLLKQCLEKLLAENKNLKTGLDLGCGSGLQGLTLAEKGLKVVCADIEAKALANAKENFERVGLKAEFRRSDLFSNIPETFDLIAFNPPYLPSEGIRFKDLEGGNEGREVLDRFIEQFPGHLNEKGLCIFLQSSLNRVSETEQQLARAGFQFEMVGREKVFFEELLVFKVWRA